MSALPGPAAAGWTQDLRPFKWDGGFVEFLVLVLLDADGHELCGLHLVDRREVLELARTLVRVVSDSDKAHEKAAATSD